MSFFGDLFSGGKGAGYQAQGTRIDQSIDASQALAADPLTQAAMSQQGNFLSALQSQGGIGNQSAVFGQQQQLAQQLAQQAAGGGPNPVQAQLAQNTGANVANQAALMGSQRGAGANVGLMARQAAQQGASTQQQAVGQAATLGAQQQLAAQQALQQQQASMANLATQQVSQQGQATMGANQLAQNYQAMLMNQVNQQNNARIAMQSNINSANAGVATQNAATQGQMFGGLLGGAAQGAMMLSDERVKKNVRPGEAAAYEFLENLHPHTYEYKNPESPGAAPGEHLSVMAQELEKSPSGKQMVKETPEGKAVDYAKGMGQMLAAQAELHERLKALEHGKMAHHAAGGMVHHYADGGSVPDVSSNPMAASDPGGPKSFIGKLGKAMLAPQGSTGGFAAGQAMGALGAGAIAGGINAIKGLFSGSDSQNLNKPGQAPSLGVSGVSQPKAQFGLGVGDLGANPALMAQGQNIGKFGMNMAHGGVANLKEGGRVKGKAKVKGDSLKNDTVPAMLSPKEIVLPRSVTLSQDAPEKAAQFVAAILSKKGIRK